MILAILSFLGSPLGKVIGIGIGIVSLGLAAWGIVAMHDSNVRTEALVNYNKNQLKQVIKDQQKFNDKMNQINDDQTKIINRLEAMNKEVTEKYAKINNYLNAPATKDRSKQVSLSIFSYSTNTRNSN